MAGVVTPPQVAALRQADMLGKDAGQQTLPALNLDHGRVLSQWENMGGKVEVDADAALLEALSHPSDSSQCFGLDDGGRCSILNGELDGSAQPSVWLDLGGNLSAETLLPQGCLIAEDGCRDGASGPDGLAGEWQLSEGGQLRFDDFEWVATDAGRVAVASEQPAECWPRDTGAGGAGPDGWLVDIKQQTVKPPPAIPSFNVVSSCPATATAPPRAPTPKVEVCAGSTHLETTPVSKPLPTTQRTEFVIGKSPATFVVPISGGIAKMQGMNCLKDGRTRMQCLQRYREKKARRLYTKKIRYELRKINADRRPRIKGRFVKKEELQEYMRLQEMPKERMGEHVPVCGMDFENSATKGEDTAIRLGAGLV